MVILKGKGKTKNRPYFTYMTPEAYHELKEYMDFRASYGEEITGESWLIRDKFPTATEKHPARKSMATNPKKSSLGAIKKTLNRALWAQGLRDFLPEGEHRHEFKLSHGFRKYFRTYAEQAGMLPSSIHIFMDHSEGGVSDNNYNRPPEKVLEQNYLKAVDYLTVNTERKERNQLQKEVVELKEERKHDNYVILGKLAERKKKLRTQERSWRRLRKRLLHLIRISLFLCPIFKGTYP